MDDALVAFIKAHPQISSEANLHSLNARTEEPALQNKERGATIMEYAVILSGVLLAITSVMWWVFQDHISDVFEHVVRLIK